MDTAILLAEGAGHGWGPGWWPIFPLTWVIFWGVLIFAVFRFRRTWPGRGSGSAEAVLAERYARGEISVQEYRERLAVLKERSS